MRSAGVELLGVPAEGSRLPLSTVLRELVAHYETTNVLVESGAGLLGDLFRGGLVNEAWVFIAPRLLGDEEAMPCVRGLSVEALTDGVDLKLMDVRRRGDDVVLRYRVGQESGRVRG